MTVAFAATNVAVPAAPPTLHVPSAAGAVVPPGGVNYDVAVVSSLYAAGSSADLAIEYEYGGVWQEDAAVGGFTLGTYLHRGTPTSTNHFGSSIGTNAVPYPSHVRLRVDRIPAGTIDSITVNII